MQSTFFKITYGEGQVFFSLLISIRLQTRMQVLLHMTGIQLMLHETPCEFDNTCSGPYPAQWNKSTDYALGFFGNVKLL